MAIISDPNQHRTLQAGSLQPVFLHRPPNWGLPAPVTLSLGWEVTEDYPLSKRKALKEIQCLKDAPCKFHLLQGIWLHRQFGATASWEHSDSRYGDKDHSALLPWLFADSSHSKQKPCQPWGCPGCLKKQMGGLTSPTLFHLLQDWSSNWAHVRTRRRATTSRMCRKHIEHIEFLHRNKNWIHSSWRILQSVLLVLNAHTSFSHSLTSRIGSPDAS